MALIVLVGIIVLLGYFRVQKEKKIQKTAEYQSKEASIQKEQPEDIQSKDIVPEILVILKSEAAVCNYKDYFFLILLKRGVVILPKYMKIINLKTISFFVHRLNASWSMRENHTLKLWLFQF